MNDSQATPIVSELTPGQENIHPAADGKVRNPLVAELVLRVLSSQLEFVGDIEKPLSFSNLLLKYGVNTEKPALEMDSQVLAELCRQKADEYSSASLGGEAVTFDVLSRQLSQMLSLNLVDTSLLRLAMGVELEYDLLMAINITGELPFSMLSSMLAGVIGVKSFEVSDALESPSLLRECDPNPFSSAQTPSQYLALPSQVNRLLRNDQCTANDIVSLFYNVAPPSELQMEDFGEHSQTVDAITSFMKGVLAKPRQGVNILLYGKPGTGKTQFIRALAQSLNKTLVEVATATSEGNPLQPWRRLKSLATIQSMLSGNTESFVLFDEVEDVFPQAGGYRNPFESEGAMSDRNKGWLTSMLDETSRPTVWLCNSISHIDPAYLRRFDLVLEMQQPDKKARRKLVNKCFSGVVISNKRRVQLIQEEQFSAGHLKKLSQVMGDLLHEDPDNADNRLEYIMAGMRKALKVPAVKVSSNSQSAGLMKYRPECVQCDTDLIALTAALQESDTARICLYGPPGTGKSEWAKHLSKQTQRPLLVKRAADLLGSFVGQTERRISEAFEEASNKKAILLIDEADSFISERSNMQRNWEVSMVNQFLTSLEEFDGICVVSTNAMGSLDQAAMRRFDFKLKFGFLDNAKVSLLFDEMIAAQGIQGDTEMALARLRCIATLTPGDFAAVARKNKVLKTMNTPLSLVMALEEEVSYKPEAKICRRFGFV